MVQIGPVRLRYPACAQNPQSHRDVDAHPGAGAPLAWIVGIGPPFHVVAPAVTVEETAPLRF